MQVSTLIIPLAFLILVSILLWYLIGAKGKWWIKLVFIIAVPSFSLMIWNALDGYLGWPTPTEAPDRFVVLWAEASEPNLKDDYSGMIYIWLISADRSESDRTILDYQSRAGEPRAHLLPYSRPLHEQLEQAKELIKEGRTVIFERKSAGDGGADGEGSEGQDGAEGGSVGNRNSGEDGDGQGNFSQEQEFRFYELPPPKFPEKNQN